MKKRPDENRLAEVLRRLAHPAAPVDLEERILARVARFDAEDDRPARRPAGAESTARPSALVLGILGAALVSAAQALGLVSGLISLGLPTAPFARAPRWISESLAPAPGVLEAPASSSLAVVLLGAGMLLYVLLPEIHGRRPAP